MSRSIYWKITIPLIALVLLTMSLLGMYMSNSTRDTQIKQLGSQLINEARLVASLSAPDFADPALNADLETVAKNLSGEIATRITFIADNGTVLGDSDQDPAVMANHSNRPEVIDALAEGVGQATRYSATLHKNMMYVAVPVTDNGRIIGVARVALPLTGVENAVNNAILTGVVAVAAAGLLVILAAVIIARLVTRPVRQITSAAEGIAAGNMEQEIQVRSSDEIGRLGRAFNEMSATVKHNIGIISDEKGRLDAILSLIEDGVVLTDMEGKLVLANQAAETLFGFNKEDVISRPLIEAVQDHETEELFKLCLRTGQAQSIQFETALSKKFLRAIATPISKGELSGVLLLFQDLTELRSLQTMRREMVGNISHELRTPIAGIKAMVETLKDGALADKTAAMDFLTRIDNEIDRLTQIVSEITELSRIESGSVELKLEPTDLNHLVEGVIEQLNTLAGRQDITITSRLEPKLPAVSVDSDRIRQTVINLVHNAIKFNRPGGRVIISTKTDSQFVTVSVSDTGIGIPKEDMPYVFERFYKADKARSKGGSGLGLAIARHTVKAHNGTIRVESEQGKGSVFTFSLPIKTATKSAVL